MTDKIDEKNALAVPSGRIARLTRLGSMTAGIAGNMAMHGAAQLGRGHKPSMRDLLLTPRNIGRVADELAKMRGAAMKIGQLMSMDTGDVLPPELTQIMARLRDDAHFMPPAQLKQVLNANWPANWLRSFKKFDVRPIAAASIGQVHRSQLKDGRDLAIKVQYPGVAQSIDSDVANVGALIKMSGMLPKGFALAPYLEEARQQLHEETDYVREGAQLQAFGALLADSTDFTVPELHADWSTPDILAMSYMPGTPIEDLVYASQETRNRVVEALINLTLSELFSFGLMQTDPNFANYLYDAETGRIVLLDFGATRVISRKIQSQYKALILAGLADDPQKLRDAALDLGFVDADTAPEHVDEAVAMIGLIFSTLRKDSKVDFTRIALSEELQTRGMALAQAGFVPPPLPIDVVFLQRKFGGMFLLAARLEAEIDVIALLNKHLELIDAGTGKASMP